jgi:DNA-binding NtrC family response regulator
MPREFPAGEEVPAPRGEVLVCGCRQEDVAVLEEVFGREGPAIRPVDEPAEMARQAVLHLPMAVFLGLRKRDRARLQIIPLLRAVTRELPVVVVADEASLELERRVRQEGVFYYFVHPLGSAEVEALSKDLLRRAAREMAPGPAAGQDVRKKRSEP